MVTEAPYLRVLYREHDRQTFRQGIGIRPIRFDGNLHMIGIGTHPLGNEHIVETSCITIATHQICHDIAGCIDTMPTRTETPTEFITIVLGHNTTLPLFPTTTLIDVPTVNIRIGRTGLVADGEVAQLTSVQVPDHDIALRPF